MMDEKYARRMLTDPFEKHFRVDEDPGRVRIVHVYTGIVATEATFEAALKRIAVMLALCAEAAR